jgi:hypothetical protein
MKQTFLKFLRHDGSSDYIPTKRGTPMRAKRFNGGAGGGNKEKEDKGEGGEGEEDPDSTAKAIEKMTKQVGEFTKLLGDKADTAEITKLTTQIAALEKAVKDQNHAATDKAIKDINEQNDKLWKQVLELQEKNAQGNEGGTSASRKGGPTFSSGDVDAFLKLTFVDGQKSKAEAKIVVIKAAETMGYANFFEGGDNTDITGFTGRMVDPTLYQRRRKRNLILDNFAIRTINVPRLLFLVKVEDGDDVDSASGDSGGAAWIVSGQMKPMRSFRVTTGEAKTKKVAIFGTVEDELLRDVPSLENWIREDFMDEMREEINDGLLNNDVGVNPLAPQGMKQDAVLFDATPAFDGKIEDANEIDAIFAVGAFMSRNREQIDRLFISDDMWYRIMILKDAEARYLKNDSIFVNSLGQLFIGGIMIVPADYEDVPSTHVLAVGRDLGFKMYAYGPMVFERGLNGEDFRYDRTSYRGYQEFLTYLPTHRENSVMYDTWENIIAQITAA